MSYSTTALRAWSGVRRSGRRPPPVPVRVGNAMLVEAPKAVGSYVRSGAKVGQDIASKYHIEKHMRAAVPTKLTEKSFAQPFGLDIVSNVSTKLMEKLLAQPFGAQISFLLKKSKPKANAAKPSGPIVESSKTKKKIFGSVQKQVRSILKEAGATAMSVLKGEHRVAEGTKALQRLLSGKKKSK